MLARHFEIVAQLKTTNGRNRREKVPMLLAVTQTCKHVPVGINLISEEGGGGKVREVQIS